MANAIPVGIDLGTTFSAVAWVNEQGRTAILRNTEGDLLTPSVVLFDEAEVVVGKQARSALGVEPDRVAQWVKRDMGLPVYSRPICGERLPPEVIQSCILRKLRGEIVRALGPDTQVVITVPAYFDEPRRKATADAGEMAGLTLLDIVNEPTAAALAFGETLGYLNPRGGATTPMTVLVYDLGGGTFDVTLLRLAPGEIRALATDGDVQLGGHDWDLRLVDYVAEEFQKQHGLDPREDLAAFHRLYNAVLEAKHTLSARTRTTVQVDFGGQSAEVPLTRQLFEERTADLLERTSYTTRQVLAAAGLAWSDVSRVLLVGGATRMPMVAEMLTALSGLTPDRTVNPDEAVARGAALYAHYLLSKAAEGQGGEPPAFEVVNISAHSLGIEGLDPETLRKTNVILLPRNTPLPATVSERFMTKQQNQRSIVVAVLEGESRMPSECTTIGRTVLRDLPPELPQGWPVDVTFQYAINGRLEVRAVVPGTHREVRMELQREHSLSQDGIAQWQQAVSSLAGFADFETLLEATVEPDNPEEEYEVVALDEAESESVERVPLLACPAVRDTAEHSTAGQASSGTRLWMLSLVGYVISALIGCGLGYLLVAWLFPQSDLLKLLH